jgi:hypothetical protein
VEHIYTQDYAQLSIMLSKLKDLEKWIVLRAVISN